MPRGTTSKPGEVRVSQNGYSYTRTEIDWKLTHWVIAEEKFGRPIDASAEQVYFKDGDRKNLEPSNIGVRPKGTSSLRKRLAKLEAQIAERQAERQQILRQLKRGA